MRFNLIRVVVAAAILTTLAALESTWQYREDAANVAASLEKNDYKLISGGAKP